MTGTNLARVPIKRCAGALTDVVRRACRRDVVLDYRRHAFTNPGRSDQNVGGSLAYQLKALQRACRPPKQAFRLYGGGVNHDGD